MVSDNISISLHPGRDALREELNMVKRAIGLFLLVISKYFWKIWKIYGVLKYIANISGLTAFVGTRSAAVFLKVVTPNQHAQ